MTEVNSLADQLVSDGHPEEDQIKQRKDEVNEAWQRLKQLSLLRQERLFGAHEIQRFNRYGEIRYEPVHEKTNNLGSDQVRHKPGCTVTEDG